MTLLVENRDLRERFKRGDADALRDVYRAYAPAIFGRLRQGFAFRVQGGRVCRFRGYGDPCELENAAQEVFCRAFAERARLIYDGLRPYHNYLFVIARNYVADQYRRAACSFVPLDELAQEEELDEAAAAAAADAGGEPTTPEQEWESRELERHIAAFVAGLSVEERSVFENRLSQGLTIEDTAARLGISGYRVKRVEAGLCKRFFREMLRHGYFEGYEGSRGEGLWRSLSLVLLAGGGVL